MEQTPNYFEMCSKCRWLSKHSTWIMKLNLRKDFHRSHLSRCHLGKTSWPPKCSMARTNTSCPEEIRETNSRSNWTWLKWGHLFCYFLVKSHFGEYRPFRNLPLNVVLFQLKHHYQKLTWSYSTCPSDMSWVQNPLSTNYRS